jgi:nucleotide-binding universal stress UspA family protein
MFRKIAIAHDGSEGARKAFDCAVELAVSFHAELHMISVEENLPQHAQTMLEVNDAKETEDSYFGQLAILCRARAAVRGITLECTVRAGHEVETVVNFVREGRFDLLVVGFMGHSRVFDRVWGGPSQNLTRIAPCSILVVK